MGKRFTDVFPRLELSRTDEDTFYDTTVERISTTRKKEYLHIYLTSRRLIEKSAIRRLEKVIKKQLFSDDDLTVRIFERFDLSSGFTPEDFFEKYRDSFFEELRTYRPVIHALLRNGEFVFSPEDEVNIRLEESVIARDQAPEIERVFEKVFNERGGFSVSVSIDYIPKKDKAGKERDERVYEPVPEEIPPEPAPVPVRSEKKERKAAAKKENRDDPDLLYGRDFNDPVTQIADLEGETGAVCIRGQLRGTDPKKPGEFAVRDTRSGKKLVIFDVTDFTDTIRCKIFQQEEQWEEMSGRFRPGAFVRVKGVPMTDAFDHELTLQSVTGIRLIKDFREHRTDDSERKRVELHCHTKMSEMDGVSEAKDIVKCAYRWGMPGIAITDHGVVQALNEADHTWNDLYKDECKRCEKEGIPKPDRQSFFKIIPGVEAYLVDDSRLAAANDKGQVLAESTFVVFDLETTGFSPANDRIIEIGAVKVENGEITDRYSTFVNPGRPIPPRIEEVTNINDDMVKDARGIEEILPEFLTFAEGAVLVGHNVSFDAGFIEQNCREQGIRSDLTTIDTVGLSRHYFPLQSNHRLDTLAKTLGVPLDGHHRAVNDAECTAGIFLKFLDYLKNDGIETVADIAEKTRPGVEAVRNMHPYHAIILAKNTKGRVNLYRLISRSHLKYFKRHPLIPKSEIEKHREGLILGSACCAGELYEAVLEERSEQEIARIVKFYDYLEIQPNANNRFMIADEKRYSAVNSIEDIENINREIVKLGREYGKPVVATTDAHFLDPSDEIYRTIIMSGKEMDEEPAPLYLRTTDEMLSEFEYLGMDKAMEVVVENPRRILDMCDSVPPVRPDKCAPVIEDSDGTLRRICYDKAHELYGENLPRVVEERLERELNSIISNGFAVMYIIAQKLVWKSVEDGYLVGSRGSVGSSFVAFAAGITEVNSLQPHYVCPECHYSDFDSDEVKAYSGYSGCDMPDRVCPVCGAKLNKDGFDIPFETFLGFNGDKEPDIDLNFSGEYQSKAHKYTEVIFGYGQTYRAGTISGLADKNAYGYVRKYYEKQGVLKRAPEIDRQLEKLVGIKTNTGQHPGGIIVLPVGEDIDSFTPVQHPANKMDSPIVTTHYDYHSIDHNLLKLDILGHDDPTMIRYLNDLTGLDSREIPLDDPEVMELFASTKSLGIMPEDIGGTKLGCLGLPEFGTDFAMQMVIEAKPTSFTHLVRISGLSHGTDVWSGNAQTLIQEGKATIDTAICTRDDIMIYLIQKGLNESLSFKIMERVRKGKGLEPEMEEAMTNAGVPDWYIWSCKKIKYMFPKAHAAAYVMMCWRIAWFKVHYPQAFYAAWFSIRSKHFDYEHMCLGRSVLEKNMREYKALGDKMTSPQKDELYDMRMVQEMYARGLEFAPLDLFRAKARHFTVVDGRVMPSIKSINGMGDKAADDIEEAAKAGAFLSKDDFKDRTRCSQTVTDTLARLGLLGDIPESNQISFFDLIYDQ